jgi:hypothetical protein
MFHIVGRHDDLEQVEQARRAERRVDKVPWAVARDRDRNAPVAQGLRDRAGTGQGGRAGGELRPHQVGQLGRKRRARAREAEVGGHRLTAGGQRAADEKLLLLRPEVIAVLAEKGSFRARPSRLSLGQQAIAVEDDRVDVKQCAH